MSEKLTQASAQFAVELLRAACEPDQNAFFSPLSISVALAMTYAGTDGKTKQQMNEVLFKDLDDNLIEKGFSELVSLLNQPKGDCVLLLANRLYGQQGFELEKDFVSTLLKNYQSSFCAVDFETETESARGQINKWVEQQTKKRICDLIGEGVLDEATRLVLVNAIYFKGDWLKKFEESYTVHKTFYSAPDRKTKVDMMRQTQRFLYTEDSEVQVLGMPYKADDMSMFVFLPKVRYGLADFEKSLTGERLLELIKATANTAVKVEIPKFKMDQSFSLSKALSSLGVSELFDERRADLSKMTGDKTLYVSAVLHKAFVEISEQGTVESAVVTRRERRDSESGPPSTVFRANHPFVVGITRRENLVFLGHVVVAA